MDPKIAAGFSLLGNALMPDPSRLAQAEVYRSQMLENQATARKTGLEADALANAANNLAQLQDLLANKEASPEEILSRAVASGITNDPSQLPRFVLGGQSLEGLDVNDPESFSRALLGTGQVANQAATPSGFASDQARQTAEAVAKDLTEQRGQDIISRDTRYDTETDAATSITTTGMTNETTAKIAQARRELDDLISKRDDLTKRHDIAVDSNDAALQRGLEAELANLERAITWGVARAKNLTDEAITKLQNEGDMNEAQLNADAAFNRTVYSSDKTLEGVKYAADARNRGAAAEVTISRAEAINLQRDLKKRMVRLLDPNFDTSNKNLPNIDVKLKDIGLSPDDLNEISQLAFKAHPNDSIAQLETAWDLIKRGKDGKFKINKRAYQRIYDALVTPADKAADAAEGEDETDAAAGTPVPEDTGAGMVTPPPGGWTNGVDRKQAPDGNWAVFNGTSWVWEATGKPAGG